MTKTNWTKKNCDVSSKNNSETFIEFTICRR